MSSHGEWQYITKDIVLSDMARKLVASNNPLMVSLVNVIQKSPNMLNIDAQRVIGEFYMWYQNNRDTIAKSGVQYISGYSNVIFNIRQLNSALQKNTPYTYGAIFCDDDEFKGM
jgi:hypothetical protein